MGLIDARQDGNLSRYCPKEGPLVGPVGTSGFPSAEMTRRSGERTRTCTRDVGDGPAISAGVDVPKPHRLASEEYFVFAGKNGSRTPWDKGMIEPKSHGK